MTIELLSLITGGFARQGGKVTLEHLPSGAELRLEPEPDNPYDQFALRVLVDPEEIPTSQHIHMEDKLEAYGMTIGDLLNNGPIWIGFVAATGGKPLAKARAGGSPGLSGNQEFTQALGVCDPNYKCHLGFTSEGAPTIKFTGQEAGA
jgi:hypothetical protein